jgi:AcrR family transcriptional regulator
MVQAGDDMTETTLTRKDRDRQRREEDFLNAAEKLFSDRGYYQTSMEDIAQAAEYATGTIYRYFPSKEELYNSILARKGKIFSGIVDEYMQDCDGPVEQLKAIIKSKAHFFFAHSDFVKIYLSQISGSSNTITPPETMKVFHEKYMSRIAGILNDGMKEGVFITMDVDLLLLSFTGMTNHLLFTAVSDNKTLSKEVIEKFIWDFLEKGLIQ